MTAGALQATCALGSCGVPPTHRLSAVKSGRICDVHTAKTDTTLSLGCVPAQILHLLCCQVNHSRMLALLHDAAHQCELESVHYFLSCHATQAMWWV